MEHKRVWIYCRVAYPDAWALSVQQKSLEAYAKEQEFEIVGITAEQASGLDFSRRGLAEVSEAVASGEIDSLLVKDLCRLGRDREKTDQYLTWLKACQVELICADGSIPQTNMEILHELLKASGIKPNVAQ